MLSSLPLPFSSKGSVMIWGPPGEPGCSTHLEVVWPATIRRLSVPLLTNFSAAGLGLVWEQVLRKGSLPVAPACSTSEFCLVSRQFLMIIFCPQSVCLYHPGVSVFTFSRHFPVLTLFFKKKKIQALCEQGRRKPLSYSH